MRQGVWRWSMLLLWSVVPGIGLLVACLMAPAAPPKTKAPTFPLNLFAQATDDDFSNEKTCASCHRASVETFARSPHAAFMNDPHSPVDKQGCQACHGPGKPHVAHRKEDEGLYTYVISYNKAKPEEIAAACLRCHNDTLTMTHWKRTAHAHAGVSCTSCHQIHASDRLGKDREGTPSPHKENSGARPSVNELPHSAVFPNAPEPKAMLKADEATLCGQCHRRTIAEFRQHFHHPIPEGRLVCSDCHSVHPNKDDRKQVRTAKQNCVTCHAEVAGPFAFEHDPTSDLNGEGCLECHRPHGSPNPAMLNTFSRGLCIRCHTEEAANHHPGRNCWDSGCHSAIHGSNHDRLLLGR
ncbi:MAG TPA: cytochrome c3 family protein [Chthonomonadaceae bacterium]|nr:cytochrome c3 family protein [Chthonomonadaceae bacterium]